MLFFIEISPHLCACNNHQAMLIFTIPHMCASSIELSMVFKQVPRVWFNRLNEFILQLSFWFNPTNLSLFVCHSSKGILMLLLYANDMVVTSDNSSQIEWLI